MNEEIQSTDNLYLTRNIHLEECEQVFILFEELDWNIPLIKLTKLVELYPKHIFVTVKKDSNEVVGTIATLPTHERQWVLGGFVVKADYRNKGLGKALLKFALELHKDEVITLTAVPGTTALYENFGFQEVEPAHLVIYLQVDRVKVQTTLNQNDLDDIDIVTYKPEMFKELNDYDTVARGYESGRYLKVVVAGSDCMLVAVSKATKKIIGYASGVDQSDLVLVDGMYADNDMVALLLFRRLLDTFPTEEFKIQVIKPRAFLSGFGEILPKSHTFTQMVKGGNVVDYTLSMSKVYVVACSDYAEG